jgi:NAD(P)-dependent dehydrogenase (short-subunit alcohol dehydrogenase family)
MNDFKGRVAVITGGATGIGVNSQRMLGRDAPSTDDADGSAQGPLQGSVIPVEEVAERVVRAIERKDLYIFTHTEQREILRRRSASQDAMFEDTAWSR